MFPYVRLQPLDGVLRAHARLIGGVPKFGNIGEFMRDTLHWLPVCQRILFRVSTIAVLSGSAISSLGVSW